MSQYWLGGISLLLRVIVIELWKLELDLLEMKILGIWSLFVSILYLQILRKTVGTGSTWNEGLGSWVAHCFCFDPLAPSITEDRTECRLYLEWLLLFNICFAFCHLIFFPSLLDWYWQIYYILKTKQVLLHLHFCYRTLNLNPLLAHYDRWCKVTSWSATTFQ